MGKRSFDSHLTAHARAARGELEPGRHGDVRFALVKIQNSPLDEIGEAVARTRVVAAGGRRSVFRMVLELIIEGFAQYGASIYPGVYFSTADDPVSSARHRNAQDVGAQDVGLGDSPADDTHS